MSLSVAIIGRPNVGKSTLFNRLAGKQLALVDDRPGVTRDRREGDARLFDLEFTIVDTAGLDDVDDKSLEGRMRQQSEIAINEAQVILFVIDARAGVMPMDKYFANLVRKQSKPVILLANKAEGKAGEAGFYESWGLGLGDPIEFSAAHGIGLDDLYENLKEHVENFVEEPEENEEDDPDKQIGRAHV